MVEEMLGPAANYTPQQGLGNEPSEAEVSKVTGYKAHLKEQQLAERKKAEDEVKCRFCGKRGHGGSPNFAVKKEKCSAFDKRCNTCGKIGHFSKTKSCRQGIAKVEELVVQHERRTGQSDNRCLCCDCSCWSGTV